MEFVILDLEWNNSFFSGSDINLNEIIEFGAVKVDEDFNVLDEFSMLIKLKFGQYVNSRTKKLTHLTSGMLRKTGKPFDYALKKFKAFLGDAVLLTWSMSDIIALMDNNKLHYGTNILDYIKSFVNLQVYCQNMLGIDNPAKQMGLTAAAEALNINIEQIEHHRALDDSLLAMECFKRLYNKDKLKSYIQDASDPDFYRRLVFKPFYILDVNNPLVERSSLVFKCEKCLSKAVRKTEWKGKNRYITAEFYCPKCKNRFLGKVQHKVNFDNIKISKKCVPITDKDDNTQNSENNRKG